MFLGKIKELNGKNKKIAVIVSLIFFCIFKFCMISFYENWYSFDEFYHISDANLIFSTEYNRAAYINQLVKLFSVIFGNNYYSVKFIPYLLSIISFCAILYVVNKLCKTKIAIYAVTFLMAGHALLVFNHLYVRMYIFEEALISLSVLFLYKFGTYNKKSGKRYIYLILCGLLVAGYAVNTIDASRLFLLGISLLVLISICMGLDRFKRKSTVIFLAVTYIILEIVLVGIKLGVIDCSNWIFGSTLNRVLLTFYTDQSPVLLIYFIIQGACWIVSLIISLRYIIKDNEKELFYIWVLIEAPLIIYLSYFYNSYVLRTFAPFMGGQIVLLVWTLEKIVQRFKFKNYIFIFIIAIVGILSYPSGGFREYYKRPSIKNETFLSDYSSFIEKIKLAEAENIKVATIFDMLPMERYFEIEPDISYTNVGDNNFKRKLTKADYLGLIEYLADTKEPYILAVTQLGTAQLNEFDLLKELTAAADRYEEFDSYKYIFYFNN